jgi:hypothetical protein
VVKAAEQLLGRPIAPDEEVSVAAVPPQRVPPSESRAAVARSLEAFLNRRADKVSGLPEEDIDAAVDELEAGKGRKFASVDALMADLNADD